MMAAAFSSHAPVMLREAVDALAPRDGGIYVDGTFGRGGYARAILEAAKTSVIGIDRDPEAIDAAAPMVRAFAPRLTVLHGTFSAMDVLLESQSITSVDGIVLDLGVSSPQLDKAERGFSFREDGALDMRMGLDGPTAADLLNNASESELADIIYNYGEERLSRRIARRIVEARNRAPITRTAALAALVREVVPRAKDGIDPATRTFQALRIAVNDEMGEIDRGLCAAERVLRPSGNLVVVSFHSLEDRRVKHFLRIRSAERPRASRHAPQASRDHNDSCTFRILTRKPQTPSAAETAANPRARSARLRAAQRTKTILPMETAA